MEAMESSIYKIVRQQQSSQPIRQSGTRTSPGGLVKRNTPLTNQSA